MYYVYILHSIDFDKYYVGMSNNVERRLKNHNSASVKSTKAYVPWKLVHSERYELRTEARKREKYLKSAAGRRWRKNELGL